jgi:hypothetical protein
MKRTCPFFFFSLIIDSAQGFLGLLLRCDLAQSVKEFHHPKIITIINNNYCYYLQAQMKTHAKNWFCFFWHHVLFCTSIIFIYINAAQLFVVQNFSSSKSFLFLKSFIGKGKKNREEWLRVCMMCVWYDMKNCNKNKISALLKRAWCKINSEGVDSGGMSRWKTGSFTTTSSACCHCVHSIKMNFP